MGNDEDFLYMSGILGIDIEWNHVMDFSSLDATQWADTYYALQ